MTLILVFDNFTHLTKVWKEETKDEGVEEQACQRREAEGLSLSFV